MNLQQYQYFLIIDLEATCCDGKVSVPAKEMETIEIGAVMVDANTLEKVDEFVTFIKPVRNPELTEFCTELTSIVQADVDNAPTYPNAIKRLKDWMCQYSSYLFCSWGDYDRNQLIRDSKFHGIPYPMGSTHLNIKKQFSSSQGFNKRFGMNGALSMCGLELEGTHHRGIDDARNMARMMPFILGHKNVVLG